MRYFFYVPCRGRNIEHFFFYGVATSMQQKLDYNMTSALESIAA
jgi:hypothetical protein